MKIAKSAGPVRAWPGGESALACDTRSEAGCRGDGVVRRKPHRSVHITICVLQALESRSSYYSSRQLGQTQLSPNEYQSISDNVSHSFRTCVELVVRLSIINAPSLLRRSFALPVETKDRPLGQIALDELEGLVPLNKERVPLRKEKGMKTP